MSARTGTIRFIPQPARLPDETRAEIIECALEHEDLTPRELAAKYTDERQYFVSESSVYRILKAEDLVTAPAHIGTEAANEFRDKTTGPNELWQTDFTYLKILAWGWFYLSTIRQMGGTENWLAMTQSSRKICSGVLIGSYY